ncbi:NADAR family protein [Streptomyces sp. NPDC088251]|uniref:NADAR family protein n=1 Tax=Streptomyces sp. NPDC088251 TaxID=3365844 RepID=UPI0037F95D66
MCPRCRWTERRSGPSRSPGSAPWRSRPLRGARTPLRAAELGRAPSKPLRRDWDRVKDDVMRRAVATKFRARADIRDILLSTADEEIVEDTTTDHYWGRGRTGTGKNMLGRILMRTRNQLRAEVQGSRDRSG